MACRPAWQSYRAVAGVRARDKCFPSDRDFGRAAGLGNRAVVRASADLEQPGCGRTVPQPASRKARAGGSVQRHDRDWCRR